jgi:hypothetical protein
MAYAQVQQRLDPEDKYASLDPGLLPDMEQRSPGITGNLKNINALTTLTWGAIAKEEDASIHRLKTTQTVLDYASWALVAGGIVNGADEEKGTSLILTDDGSEW